MFFTSEWSLMLDLSEAETPYTGSPFVSIYTHPQSHQLIIIFHHLLIFHHNIIFANWNIMVFFQGNYHLCTRSWSCKWWLWRRQWKCSADGIEKRWLNHFQLQKVSSLHQHSGSQLMQFLQFIQHAPLMGGYPHQWEGTRINKCVFGWCDLLTSNVWAAMISTMVA